MHEGTERIERPELTAKVVVICLGVWLGLALIELAPALYMSWVNGFTINPWRVLRAFAAYGYWIIASLAIRELVIRHPVRATAASVTRHSLAFLAIMLLHVVFLAGSYRAFKLPGAENIAFIDLLAEQFLNYVVAEFVAYAAVAAAWTLHLRHMQNRHVEGLFVKDNGTRRFVHNSEILCLEAMDNYVILRLSGEKLIHRGTLSGTVASLGRDFVRVHRSHAVRRQAIRSFDRNESKLTLVDGVEVPVGKRRQKSAMEALRPLATES